ncbi:hypothetical protein Pla175_20220 [Pirellulimonas nuda]|uniref:DUF4381 domain-containing protein n=1 Tax=Pirellulimonas nuda TaxID=2528009 RepID=A0A518DB02_9BACT|nr:hypothetical protein [Pirellulimonas nuda]QDU88642.1 hypothetical protein Pla175_20220 [Pirellulimonas nuda]
MTGAYFGVLATRDQWERLGDRFSGEAAELSATEAWGVALVCIGLLGVLALLSLLARVQSRRSRKNRPLALLRELCRAHRLSHADRQLLAQVVEECGLICPAEIFVRPDLLAPDRYGSAPAAVRTRIAGLRQRLFEGRDDQPLASPPSAPEVEHAPAGAA